MSVSAESMLRVRVAGQLSGNQETTYLGATGNDAVDNGYSIAVEGLNKVLPFLQVGVGIEYEVGRQQADFPGNFQYVPIYGVARVPFDIGPIIPYAVGRIGYGLFSGDSTYTGGYATTGGLYYAVGGGIDLRFGKASIFAEGTYSADNGSLSISGDTANIFYTRIDLSAGLSITF
jgi:hypothetical protein